jgi:hypothetical protein
VVDIATVVANVVPVMINVAAIRAQVAMIFTEILAIAGDVAPFFRGTGRVSNALIVPQFPVVFRNILPVVVDVANILVPVCAGVVQVSPVVPHIAVILMKVSAVLGASLCPKASAPAVRRMIKHRPCRI